MGGGSGQVALDWFDTMYEELAPLGIAFTAIAVITHPIGLTPLGKGEPDASFADAALAAHGQDDPFFDGAVLMIAGKRLEIIGAGLNHKRECFLNPSWRSR
jgi:hypothetical protein